MWLLLAGSLLSLQFWLPLSLSLLIVTFILAAVHNTLTPVGIAIIIFLSVIAYLSFRFRERRMYRIGLEVVLVLASIALTMHYVPGFNNLKVLDSVDVGPQSAPFTMYYNLDKALIPFLLLACLHTLFKAPSVQPPAAWLWFILILSVPALLVLAVYIGGLQFEQHRPEWIWQFILSNIFFVSLAEEALFRGYLQQRLTGVMSPKIALVITSALFGLLHYAGGVQLIIFAGLAGIIYGLAWMWSGRLWVATLFHFGLNLTHLLFFTYPVYLPRW
jgi:membrane protease YdiL (CAAX protease family)